MEEKSLELILFSDGILEEKSFFESDAKREAYLRVFTLLPSQVEKYTMGDSSSVPAETAEEMFRSILFTVKKAINAQKMPFNSFLSCDIEAVFKLGREIIDSETQKGREIFDKVKANAPTIVNISYRDTIKGIEGFFRSYESRFFAHTIPGSIDYQLCHGISEELLGIDYINEYLRVMFIENSFFAHFEQLLMKIVLKSHCPDYRELLVNLYEPLAVNALALALTGGEIRTLLIEEFEQKKLYEIFSTQQNTAETLENAAETVCLELGISDAEQVSYLKQTAGELAARIKAALKFGSLAGVFPAVQHEKSEKKTVFTDFEAMDDEVLRELIDEINDCRYISDKCDIVLQRLKSLRDLAEILGVCFWEGESLTLFEKMGKAELSILLDFAQKREESDYSETGWEKKLIGYMKK